MILDTQKLFLFLYWILKILNGLPETNAQDYVVK